MNGTTHTGVAVVFTGAVAAVTWGQPEIIGIPVYQWLLLPTAVAGGLKADIDMENNPQFGSGLMSKLFTHRGFTHTGLVTGAFYVLAYLLNSTGAGLSVNVLNSLIMGFFLGYFSHVFIDVFNRKGCPIFWPIFPKRMHITRVTTGTYQEPIFLAVAVLMILLHVILKLGGHTI